MNRYFDNNMVTIEVTNKCSAACIMCPREQMIHNIDTMKFEVWKKIIDESCKLNIEFLDLCGYGDVFLDTELFKKIEYAKNINKNFKIYISTTAIAMTLNKWDKILKYVDILKFSIYGRSKNTYEKVMKNIDYEKAHRNINGFLEINNKNNDKVYTIGNYIILDENKHEFEDWVEYWQPRLSEVYAWKPHNYTNARNYRDISGKEKKTCGRPLEGPLNIAYNGDAHVCCFDFNKHLTVGNIKNNSITEIINSDKMKIIQNKHLNNDFSDLICFNCDQTIKDDSVLVYKTNMNRVVGQSNSSMYVFKSGK